MQVEGILETALYVADLDRSEAFYRELFEWESLGGDDRMRVLAIRRGQVLLLFRRGGSVQGSETSLGFIPGHDGSGETHLAFAITAETLDGWRSRLSERGIPIESEVHWTRGGTSLYFRDPDQHCIELATPGIWANY